MPIELCNITVDEFRRVAHFPHRSLIAARPEMPVRQALSTMSINNITCLPIYSHDHNKGVQAIITLLDILDYILRYASVENHAVTLEAKKLSDPIENVTRLDADAESYRMYYIEGWEKMEVSIKAFASGYHHVLVNDSTPWILSQSDIIRYIYSHPESIPNEICVKSLSDYEKTLVTARDDMTAIEVLRKMSDAKLSSLPIINSENEIAANMSLSDLRGITLQGIQRLGLPAIDYLKIHGWRRIENRKSTDPVALPKSGVIIDSIQLMARLKVHRVWVLIERKPIGVVSITDVMKLLAEL
ncbi:uncharacterized protein VTP21DRAFT_10047 [Calcarisporiella thermophila]|uniref:uncharacterized protein n=1 Tax=Calcarisporiella thermophila TaxID=911321 RepID=UPI0037443430